MTTFAQANIPGVELTRTAAGPLLAGLLVFFAFNASFTGQLAPANAVIRITYAMARDNTIFSKSFASLNAQHRTPTRIIVTLGAIGIGIDLFMGLIFGPFIGFTILAITATISHFIAHILVNVSLPVYQRKHHRLSWNTLTPSIIATILILAAFYLVIFPIHFPIDFGPITVVIWLILGEIFLRKEKLSKKIALTVDNVP